MYIYIICIFYFLHNQNCQYFNMFLELFTASYYVWLILNKKCLVVQKLPSKSLCYFYIFMNFLFFNKVSLPQVNLDSIG